jgi:cation transport protein ChaC
MWVFGYGSLMTDGWEKNYGCTQRAIAELKGYRRSFNKASVTNWGTRDCPCPTLNLVSDTDACCLGVAFEFSETQRTDVEAYLAQREGRNFTFSNLEVTTSGSGSVQALVPMYSGKNVLRSTSMQAIVESVHQAHGSSGKCIDYIFNIYDQLAKLGINDPVVTQMRDQLCRAHLHQ